MRRRAERKIRKRLRNMRAEESILARAVARLERRGLSLREALRNVLLDPTHDFAHRAAAGRLLALAADSSALAALLALFHRQVEKDHLYATALTLEQLNDRRALPPLIRALLEDPNPHRRHAAARALGWIHPSSRAAARALARCLSDPSQPQPAREEAAESLSYVGTTDSLDALIAALSDPDVPIRFWAAFGLGGCSHGEPRAIQALASILHDPHVPPGNWWSVGREALAALAGLPILPHNPYRQRVATETAAILANPNATPEDRRWAEFYASGK
ncbi:MAG: HEAT repeat domain-containing protein [Acidobacteria bacterium]|nr:HEAT repeat domain-containing protein [Acidobacteriota bacterium]